MRAGGRSSGLESFKALLCRVRSGSTGGCIAILDASPPGGVFWNACCISKPRGPGVMFEEPKLVTSMSLFIVMLRGVCVSIWSNFGDAPADVSRCVPSLAVDSRGFLCGSNGLLVSDEIVVDLDGVFACLTGTSPDCEPRFGVAIALSACCNICLNWSRANSADHLSLGSTSSISGKARKTSPVVSSQRCCLRIFLCSCNTAVDNFPL